MGIKSERFPEAFEELFMRFDSPDRDKKDVAFLMLEESIAENKTLKSEGYRFRSERDEAIHEKQELQAENKTLKHSNELLLKSKAICIKGNANLCKELQEIKESMYELLNASINFNDRVLELVPFINADRAFAQNHGCDWLYGDWKTERETLISAIRRVEALKEETK